MFVACILDFQAWLKYYELENNCEYFQSTGKKRCNDGNRTYYDCCRTGLHEDIDSSKRTIKSQGSKKININCTSHLILLEPSNEVKCIATFYKKHHGHKEDELQHLKLPIKKKHEIATKLSQGVTFEKVLNNIRDNIGTNLKREDLITRADLHNIKQKYNITLQDGKFHKNDAISVDIWVEEMKKEENNPVIYYKKQGDVDVKGILDSKDFCIILMDSGQEHMLHKFGQGKVICLDGTHGLNSYDFELVTLMVIDDFGSGFPCCYMFTNLKDTKIYSFMFTAIKEITGIIKPQTFMSDIVETFYSAWENIMRAVPHRLLCSWHVDRAWQHNLYKVTCSKRKEKQSSIYKSLKVLQTISDETDFKKFLNEMLNDLDTRDFGLYFESMYGIRPTLWAYCHRKGLGVNCNMHLESMHKTIKYYYLNGCKIGRLDKSIKTIRKFTRDKKVERMIKLTKGKYTTRNQEVKKRHNKSIQLNLKINLISTNKWKVESENIPDQFYVVQKVNDDVCCGIVCGECKICIHTFKCNCQDYLIKSIICKHIHKIVLTFIESIEENNTAEPIFTEELNTIMTNYNKIKF